MNCPWKGPRSRDDGAKKHLLLLARKLDRRRTRTGTGTDGRTDHRTCAFVLPIKLIAHSIVRNSHSSPLSRRATAVCTSPLRLTDRGGPLFTLGALTRSLLLPAARQAVGLRFYAFYPDETESWRGQRRRLDDER